MGLYAMTLGFIILGAGVVALAIGIYLDETRKG